MTPRERTVVGGHPVHQSAFGCHPRSTSPPGPAPAKPRRSRRSADPAAHPRRSADRPAHRAAAAGRSDRWVPTARREVAVVGVHQPGQPVRALDGVVDAQHVRERPDPPTGRRIRVRPNVRWAMPSAPLAIESPASAAAARRAPGQWRGPLRLCRGSSLARCYDRARPELTGSPQRSSRIARQAKSSNIARWRSCAT